MKGFIMFLLVIFSTALCSEPVRYVRFQKKSASAWGILHQGTIHEIKNAPWIDRGKTGKTYSFKKVILLPPVDPSKVLAVGLNFRSHSGNSGAAKPEIFAKFPSSLHGGGDVIIPSDASNVHYEGELVIVIGKRLKKANEKEAGKAIFAVTIGNDVSERNWQSSDLQWARGKGSDGFAPVGPWLVQGLDWSDLMISTYVNGKLRQKESTRMLIHSPRKTVSWISRYITLEPGDIIFTGTPGRTQAIKNGDVVEVKIEKIGTLKNRFIWE